VQRLRERGLGVGVLPRGFRGRGGRPRRPVRDLLGPVGGDGRLLRLRGVRRLLRLLHELLEGGLFRFHPPPARRLLGGNLQHPAIPTAHVHHRRSRRPLGGCRRWRSAGGGGIRRSGGRRRRCHRRRCCCCGGRRGAWGDRGQGVTTLGGSARGGRPHPRKNDGNACWGCQGLLVLGDTIAVVPTFFASGDRGKARVSFAHLVCCSSCSSSTGLASSRGTSLSCPSFPCCWCRRCCCCPQGRSRPL
ncbi:unnamed protein product, partial [Ectocarpus sp. 8 AP-2014]